MSHRQSGPVKEKGWTRAELLAGPCGPGERGCSGSPEASFLGSLPVLQHMHERQAAPQGHPPWGLLLCLFYHLTGGTYTWVVLWRHIPPWPNAGLESHEEGEAGGCYCSKTPYKTPYNVMSHSEHRRQERHLGVAVSVLLPCPFRHYLCPPVELESWDWCFGIPHPHLAPH